MTDDLAANAPLVTQDAFLGGRLWLRQPARGFRAGVDAVLLAAAVPGDVGHSVRVLDAGAGVGTAGLCLARRCPDAHVVLLERDPGLACLAADNIVLNELTSRARVMQADLLAPAGELEALGLKPASFEHVIANPPFHDEAAGTPAAGVQKAMANAMRGGTFSGWARCLARVTCADGTATLIHKAEALAEVLDGLNGRFGALRVLPIAPRPGTPAIRILVHGRKGSRAPLSLLSPFVLHGASGHGFTQQAEAILKQGAGLPIVG